MSWYQTGVQDCQNVFSFDEFEEAFDEHKNEGAEKVVDAHMNSDDWADYESWVEQNEDSFEGLAPLTAFNLWKSGWRACAIRHVEGHIEQAKKNTEVYYLSADNGLDVVETFTDFDDAMDHLVKMPPPAMGTDYRIELGDLNGPHETMITMDYRMKPMPRGWAANDWRDWERKRGLRSNPRRMSVRRRNPRRNPTDDTKRAAVGKFKEFWRQEPTKIGEFPSSFVIPKRAHKLGRAVNILYESKKTDPETLKKPKKPLAYIHEHDAWVEICDLQGQADTDIPDFIHKAQALVCLGQCLGFKWKDDDGEHEAEGTDPLPDVWCTVDGRALLIVQSRRKVLQIIWGGSLGVEARGIVG